jgi:hypothetical protein
MLNPPKKAPSFELLFRPSVELISVVRSFVADFYARVVQDPDAAYRIALSTHELLENVAKYSTDGETTLFVECEADSVSVRTINRASAERIALLEQAFAEMSEATTADTMYIAAMRRSAARASGSGGLGLARIWAEGEMKLTLVVEADRVEIRASGKITSG